MNIKTIAAAALSLVSWGCANISTIDRTTTLPPRQLGIIDGTGPKASQKDGIGSRTSGLAIHLDAAQRLAFSKNGVICAEPSPDALQAFAASQGFSLDIFGRGSAAAANALSTSSASIGLRTQSITLMRDHLYRICEASYNGQLTEFDVAQLLRRSQDLTLGVLAIEQLTGVVVASQAAISTKSNADASANLAATQASLTAARETEQSRQKDLMEANQKQIDQQKVVNDKTTLIGSTTDVAEKERLKKELEEEQRKLKLAESAVKNAEKNVADAQKVVKTVEENLGKATLMAEAAAEGKAELSGGIYINRIDSTTVEKITVAASEIVGKVINKSHIVDSCISIINKFAELEVEAGKQKERLRAEQEQVDILLTATPDDLRASQKKIIIATELEQKKDLITQMHSVRKQCLKVLIADVKKSEP
ncbi:hypothetical protein C8R32_10999 [Nitrosospira sp. Nsp5]|uniref:Uncharacterized protein n=1 Tax=Nitrosospira multiformis TaxID=1231 RepID=A0ABY0TIQ9_9PROT|nr:MULTISPECIES: hypothetical protein [Nitrosospira]PTR06813.1 hypothetical protein C8R32_10999 [Nitrosospira sp. Nsp5]SDQ88900.1 hypothetical protein SAMN05216402_2698 [Nitrosospira multiformis]